MAPHSLRFYGSVYQSLWRQYRNCPQAIAVSSDRSLRSLLTYASKHVPFQRERLSGLDLKTSDLEQIRPTNKTEMMASFDSTIADGAVTLDDVLLTDQEPVSLRLPIIRGKYLVVKTSGTSGKPSWMISNIQDWATLLGATYARMASPLLTPWRLLSSAIRPIRTATIAAEHAHSMTWQGAQSAGSWAGGFGRSHFLSVIDSVESLISELDAFVPEHLHGYPTSIEKIARTILEGAPHRFEPRLITVGSEPLTDMARDTIKQAFPRSLLIDHYGMSECLALSTECAHGRKHINSDFAILEPRDSDGRPVVDGALSDHVLVTNLVNRCQPIIRYRVDDSVRIFHGSCPCGSAFPVVEIVSRKGSVIHLIDHTGRWQTLTPPIAVDTFLKARGVAQYQLVHLYQNRLEIRFTPLTGCDPLVVEQSIRHQFERVLRRLACLESVEIKVARVDELQRTGIGHKLQQIVSMVSAPELRARMPKSVSAS